MEDKKISSKSEFDAECIRIQNEIESLARSICSTPASSMSWSALCSASRCMSEAVYRSHLILFK